MNKHSFIILLFLVFANFSVLKAQNTELDSLQNLLDNHSEDDTVKINLFLEIAYAHETHLEKVLINAKKGLELAEELDFESGKAKAWRIMGDYYSSISDYSQSFQCYEKGLKVAEKIGSKTGITACLNGIGIIYDTEGNYTQALIFYQKGLKLNEEIGSKEDIEIFLINIGVIHDAQGNHEKALEYYKKALKISENIEDKEGRVICLLNIGDVYITQKEYDKSLDYTKQGLALAEEIGYHEGVNYCLESLGEIYQKKGDYEQAFQHYNKALNAYQEIDDKYSICTAYLGIARLHFEQQDYAKSLDYANKTLQITNEIQVLIEKRDTHELLSQIYATTNEYQKAYKNYLEYKMLNDSVFNKKNIQETTGLEYQYKHEKEKQVIALEQAKKDAIQEAESKQQSKVRNLLITGIVLTILCVLMAVYGLFLKRKANTILAEQKQEIENTNEEPNQINEELNQINEELNTTVDTVNEQKSAIEKNHQKTQASINYASRIQQALLPSQKMFSKFFPEHFILYKPKDIVSGDFYYFKKINQFLAIAVGDCTGHGVPGAFVSLLGIAFLNEIIAKKEIKTSAQVLEELRKQVKTSLKQTSEDTQSKDGIDISFCIINTETKILQFSGAYSPLYLIRDKELLEIKGTKNPIGIHLKEKAFENHEIQLQKEDRFYLFSDGYQDQFGGDQGMKFMTKKFKQLLLEVSTTSFEKQKEILESKFQTWKKGRKQVDDITVLGFKV